MKAAAPSLQWQPPPAALVVVVLLATRLAALAGMIVGKGGDLGQALGNAAAHTYDAAWFDIAVQHGYGGTTDTNPVAAFFPGYPLLVAALYWPALWLAGLVVHGAALPALADAWLLPAAVLVVCNLSLVLAVVLLWRLYEPRLGSIATAIGLGLLLAWPSAFFLSAGYSEASFLAAAAGCLLLAERGRWGWAGVLGAAACLIRAPGIFLAFPLALIWLRSSHPRPLLSTLAGATAFAFGALAFHAYLWLSFGDPLLYVHLQAAGWHRQLGGSLRALAALGQDLEGSLRWLAHLGGSALSGEAALTTFLQAGALMAGGLAVALGWGRLRAWEMVWILAILGLPLSTGITLSVNRFLLVAFPVFMLAGWWLRSRPLPAMLLMTAFSLLLFEQAREFARVVPVG